MITQYGRLRRQNNPQSCQRTLCAELAHELFLQLEVVEVMIYARKRFLVTEVNVVYSHQQLNSSCYMRPSKGIFETTHTR